MPENEIWPPGSPANKVWERYREQAAQPPTSEFQAGELFKSMLNCMAQVDSFIKRISIMTDDREVGGASAEEIAIGRRFVVVFTAANEDVRKRIEQQQQDRRGNP